MKCSEYTCPCCISLSLIHIYNTFIIADGKEAWVLETLRNQWVAKRISDPYYSISNTCLLYTSLSVTRIGITIYGMNSNWTKDLDTFNIDLPAITLYDIEPERFEIKDDIYNGVNMNNSIEYTWSEFAPTIYEVRQREMCIRDRFCADPI